MVIRYDGHNGILHAIKWYPSHAFGHQDQQLTNGTENDDHAQLFNSRDDLLLTASQVSGTY